MLDLASPMVAGGLQVAGALGHIVKMRQAPHFHAAVLRAIVRLRDLVAEQALAVCAPGHTARTIPNHVTGDPVNLMVAKPTISKAHAPAWNLSVWKTRVHRPVAALFPVQETAQRVLPVHARAYITVKATHARTVAQGGLAF